MLGTIGTFLGKTFGKQFFLQYFFSKGLDKLGNRMESKILKAGLWELFDETYKCLCDRNRWEYNIDAVHDSLQKKSISIDKLSDIDYVNSFLCEILGENYTQYYDVNISEQWYQCLCECMVMPKFEKLYMIFQIDKIKNIEDDLKNKITSEEAWRMREVAEREKNGAKAIEKELNKELDQKIEYELAIKAMEAEEYEKAIDGFRKIGILTTDEKIKYQCLYNESFCYSKLANDVEGYQKAIYFYQKAEKYVDTSRDDAVLLYRNIALLYTYIGQEQEKVLNYKSANNYFEKVLECAKDGDDYYIVDVILHIARNYMDMCDEVSMNEVKDNLSIAFVLMVGVCLVNGDELSVEQAYLLLHNMGRVFYHIAEKEDMPQLRKQAQELYLV